MEELLQIPPKQRWIFSIGSLIFLVSVAAGVWFQEEAIFFVPSAIIVGLAAIWNIKHLWYLAAFSMPLSLTLGGEEAGTSSIAFPSDIFCLLLMGLIVFKLLKERRIYLGLYNHPIAWVLGLYFFWMLLSAIGSTMMVVSLKAWISNFWMFMAFFFVSTFVFSKRIEIERFFWLVGIGFILAEAFIMYKYATGTRSAFDLRFDPRPFFYDHTIYGAFTTLFIPTFFLMTFRRKLDKDHKTVSLVILGFFLIGLFFSYSRGAWASTAGGMVLMYALVNRQKVKRFIIPIAAVVTIVVIGAISFIETDATSVDPREKGDDAVSRKTLGSHVMSMTNFSTDYSNTERINRWLAAIKMWEERPLMGHGPGTYAFQYGAFQYAKYRTPVSTFRGDNGTTHQEMLLALSEMGLPGAILVTLLFLLPLIYGVRGYLLTEKGDNVAQILYLGITFGLVSYSIHAFVNNFLDQDKIGIPYYAMLAALVALDINRKRDKYIASLKAKEEKSGPSALES